MIARMRKVYVVVRGDDRDRLLEALRELGVVHLMPVDPGGAVAEDKTMEAIQHLQRAEQILSDVEPSGRRPDLSGLAAAEEVLGIQRQTAEGRSRLSVLYRELQQLAVWGEVRLEQFQQLHEAGVDPKFFSVPKDDLPELRAEMVQVLHELPGKRLLVAVIDRNGQPEVPDSARPIALPQRDRPSIRAEAAKIDTTLKRSAGRQAELAYLLPAMRDEGQKLRTQAEFTVAERGGLTETNLYAIQGWVPAEAAESLPGDLNASGLAAGVQTLEPAKDEQPPTLVRYPRWARPIKGLFDMLGTLPGYREVELSGFFMIALPIFAAMLIGDAGYGLLFVLVPALRYRKFVGATGKPAVHLLMVMGFATIVWGLLSGVYFGVTPQQLLGAAAPWAAAGKVLAAVQVIRGNVEAQTYTIMKISFVLAAIHLSLAQLRQALDLAPRLETLSKVGWAAFLWGVFLLIWYLFFVSQQSGPPHWLMPYLLIGGAGLAIVFASPNRNPAKMLGLGLAQFPLSALGTFSDSVSYIRLVAVGLASAIIGQTFNGLGAQVAAAATWFAGAFVLLVGHALNIAMCMIAILAHGVRLNMLEFSTNAGVQWAGYAYQPFAAENRKER